MAEKQGKKPKATPKAGKPGKKQLSVRERASAAAGQKPPRLRRAASRAKTPLQKVRRLGRKEVHLPLPDNRTGRILGKRVRLTPKFVSEAFSEIRQVTWPDRRSTIRLTIAVFIFAVALASFVGALDYVLGELFERFFVNNS